MSGDGPRAGDTRRAPSPRAVRFHDALIDLGLLSQLVFLAMVDVGTLHAFRERPMPWYHVAGLLAVNALVLGAFTWAWRFVRTARRAR